MRVLVDNLLFVTALLGLGLMSAGIAVELGASYAAIIAGAVMLTVALYGARKGDA